MRQLQWDDLRLFLALARFRTVRDAASELGVSHSTIARRAAQLEEAAGVELFRRPRSEFALTEAGEDVMRVAERMENEVAGLQRRALGRDPELKGPIVLTMLDIIALEPLIASLAQFRDNYPGIDLTLDISMSRANLDRGEADIALRFGTSPDGHLIGRQIVDTARAVYATRAYVDTVLANGDGSWIGYTAAGDPEHWKAETPFPSLPTALRIEDMKVQQSACRSGLGLAFLPCMLCDPDPELIRISKPDFPDYQRLWLLKHPDMRGNARVRALTAHLETVFADLKPLLKGETAETVPVQL